MTRQQAEFVRDARTSGGEIVGSYRYVAERYYQTFGGTWEPPSNQEYGIALCREAGEILGEDLG